MHARKPRARRSTAASTRARIRPGRASTRALRAFVVSSADESYAFLHSARRAYVQQGDQDGDAPRRGHARVRAAARKNTWTGKEAHAPASTFALRCVWRFPSSLGAAAGCGRGWDVERGRGRTRLLPTRCFAVLFLYALGKASSKRGGELNKQPTRLRSSLGDAPLFSSCLKYMAILLRHSYSRSYSVQ